MVMKKITLPVIMTILLAPVLLIGCTESMLTGSGNPQTERFNFSEFSHVEIGGAFEVEVVQSDSCHVSITADDNLFQYIELTERGSKLEIGLKPGTRLTPGTFTFRVNITMPDLQELELSGATYGTVQGLSSAHDFTLRLSGNSQVDMSNMSTGNIEFNLSGASRVSGSIIASGDAQFDLSGASKVELAGTAKDVQVEASGASQAELADFTVEKADFNLSGASNGTVNVNGRLDANLSGGSRLSYVGEPIMGTISLSGGSTLGRK
jgi:hypothetical protein